MGWLHFGEGAYFHHDNADGQTSFIQVAGVPEAGLAGMNVLLLI